MKNPWAVRFDYNLIESIDILKTHTYQISFRRAFSLSPKQRKRKTINVIVMIPYKALSEQLFLPGWGQHPKPPGRWITPLQRAAEPHAILLWNPAIIDSLLSLPPCAPSLPLVICLPKEIMHSGWYRLSVCLILLLFTVNNKALFFFFLLHQCLVSFVSMCLHSWVQSMRSGIRVCKAHQGKSYLVSVCWSGLLDFPGDAHQCRHAPCLLSISYFTRIILLRSNMLRTS